MAKKRKKKAYWIIIVVLLAVLVAIGFIFFRTEILRFFKADVVAKDAGVQYTIPIATGSVVASENGYIYIYTDSGLSVCKSNGEFLRSYLLSYTDTKIAYSDTHVVVYDKGATSYTVFCEGKKVDEYTAKTAITYVFAFDEYMFLLCEGLQGYLGAVYCSTYQTNLIIPDGYKNDIQYSGRYPVYLDMFDDKEQFAVVSCVPDDMSKTHIEVFEIGKPTPIAGITLDGFLPKTVCLQDGRFLVANDTDVLLIDKVMEKTSVFKDQQIVYLKGYENQAYGYGIIDGEDRIFKIDSDGTLAWKKALQEDVQGFSVFENKLVIWKAQTLSMFTLKGNDFHTVETDSLIQQVIAIGGHRLAILTSRNVIVYKY